MFRRSSAWVLCAALLSSFSFPVLGFVRVRHPDTGELLQRTDASGISFLINDRTVPGMTNSSGGITITSGSDPLAALRAAMSTWSAVATSNVSFLDPGNTPASAFGRDGKNIITFVDTPANRGLTQGALAMTVVTFNTQGEITDTDIVFNPNSTFSTNNEPGTFDLQAVATHELGHALGAGHSSVQAATMFQATAQNSSLQARLTDDDIAFVTSAYPKPGALARFGQITGAVVRKFGALVTAADPVTGVVIGNISLPDGSYTIPAVPPGEYYVYAEPADGPVRPSDLPVFFNQADTGFATTVYSYLPAARPVTAVVNPGQTTTINFNVTDQLAAQIDFVAVLAPGEPDLTKAVKGPVQVRAGDVFDAVIGGAGLDDPSIQSSDVMVWGSGLTVLSAYPTTDSRGAPGFRMTILAPGNAPYGAASIFIAKPPFQGAASTGALKVLGGERPSPGQPELALSPDRLFFNSSGGTQSVSVGGLTGLRWLASAVTDSGGGWLQVTPSSGVMPGTFQVKVDPARLEPGTYAGHVTVSAVTASPKVVQVTLSIPPPPPPVFLATGVVSAASFSGGGVVPGEIISITGRNLGPAIGVVGSPDPQTGNLPTKLARVAVYVGGMAAPLFFVRQDQINLQVPFEAAGKKTVDLAVEYFGMRSSSATLPVLEARPSLFTTGPFAGAGQAAALNEDSTPNSAANPARVGSVVQLFLTGQGVVSPPVVTGQRAPSAPPFPAPQKPVRVFLGNSEAQVLFAGLAPGMVGLLQVNAVVPNGFARGNLPVVVRVGDIQSAPLVVTLAVQPAQ